MKQIQTVLSVHSRLAFPLLGTRVNKAKFKFYVSGVFKNNCNTNNALNTTYSITLSVVISELTDKWHHYILENVIHCRILSILYCSAIVIFSKLCKFVQELHEFSEKLTSETNAHYERSKPKQFLYANIAYFEQTCEFYITFTVNSVAVLDFFHYLKVFQHFRMFDFICWNCFIYMLFSKIKNKMLLIKIINLFLFSIPRLAK